MKSILIFSFALVCTATSIYSQPKSNSSSPGYNEWITGGTYHSLFIRKGVLYSSGQNVYGQNGQLNKTDSYSPQQVGTATNYTSVSTGTYTTLALRSDSTIWAWGYNNYGEVGNGNKMHQFGPVRVGKDTTWTSISVGESFCLAIKLNGTLWGWGINSNGELGTGGNPYNSLTPIQIGKDNNWLTVSAGVKYTLGIKKDGTLWAWGSNP